MKLLLIQQLFWLPYKKIKHFPLKNIWWNQFPSKPVLAPSTVDLNVLASIQLSGWEVPTIKKTNPSSKRYILLSCIHHHLGHQRRRLIKTTLFSILCTMEKQQATLFMRISKSVWLDKTLFSPVAFLSNASFMKLAHLTI